MSAEARTRQDAGGTVHTFANAPLMGYGIALRMSEIPKKISGSGRRRWGRWLIALSALALIVTGCRSVGYYKQAAAGQWQIFSKREEIVNVLRQPDTRPALREKLELILALRDYAERELKLKPDGHYTSYADLGRRYVVWNVYAAPEFSLEPKKWWYPVVGSLKYRGFFNEAEARAYGDQLTREGYDVCVGGVEAYSTLGFFKDPVLNTFIHHDEANLAELLFHELSHQRVFAKGDTDFNEAFATTAGEEGARRWMNSRGDTAARTRYEQELRRKDQFVALIMGARERLKEVYGEESAHGPRLIEKPGSEQLVATKRARKRAVIDQLQRDYEQLKAKWGGDTSYDRWFSRSLNNAQLNTVSTYYNMVPALTHLLARHDGDLEKFYAECKALAHLTKEQRSAELEKFEAPR
ncbi:MAG TPA: aminopeptidase [Candidatus Acidoferrum sp.]|nr:aminopeptidase [Candidatus Acidoferrum sp.]